MRGLRSSRNIESMPLQSERILACAVLEVGWALPTVASPNALSPQTPFVCTTTRFFSILPQSHSLTISEQPMSHRPSRRRFLKQSTFAGLSVWVAARDSRAADAPAPNEKLNIGIIGATG